MTTTSTFSGMEENAKPSSRVLRPPGGGSSNIFGNADPTPAPAAASARTSSKPADSGIFGATGSGASSKGSAQRSARDGSYNPITGSDYNDLAPNHHALNVKETPKPQKEQPPLPGSDAEYQVREGKMQNVQTSTRISNPPGGKTHRLW